MQFDFCARQVKNSVEGMEQVTGERSFRIHLIIFRCVQEILLTLLLWFQRTRPTKKIKFKIRLRTHVTFCFIFLPCFISSSRAELLEYKQKVSILANHLEPSASSTQLSKVILYPKCFEDSHCAGEQICHFQLNIAFRLTEKPTAGECRCPIGSVLWKWRCYLTIPKLGSHCVVSRQCQIESDPKRHCNPLTRKCDCEPGHTEVWRKCVSLETVTISPTRSELFQNTTQTESTMTTPEEEVVVPSSVSPPITTTSPPNDTRLQHHQEIIETVLAKVNATLLKSHEDRSFLEGNNGTLRGHRIFQWDSDRVNTVAYIGLALICVFLLGIVSAFYVRMMKDKRRSRAAIRSLLDLMSENRSMQSVYTMDGNAPYNGQNNNHIRPDPIQDFVDPDCSSSSGDSLTYCDSFNCTRRGQILEDRIHLPPIEDPKYPKLPSPHQSIPVLPPIRRPNDTLRSNKNETGISRPRPVPSFKNSNQTESEKSPSPDAISAISQNLSEGSGKSKQFNSVASFPDDEDSVQPFEDLQTQSQKLETQLILRNIYESDTSATFM